MRIKFELDTESATDITQAQAMLEVLAGRYTSQAGEIVLPADFGVLSGAEAPAAMENPEGAPAVDSRGFPWDERIHTSSKATNADGTWRNRRGVDKDLVAEVEAELRGEPAAPPPPPPPPPPAAPAPMESGEVAAAPASSEIPNPPAPAAVESAGGTPAVPAPPTPAGAPTFPDLMAVVQQRQKPNGPHEPADITAAAVSLGVEGLVGFSKPENAHLIPLLIQAIS